MAKKKIRPMQEILLDMEVLRMELISSHDLQWADMIFELHGWLMVHAQSQREEYMDDSHPELYYGPRRK